MDNTHIYNNIQQKTPQAQNVTLPPSWIAFGLHGNHHDLHPLNDENCRLANTSKKNSSGIALKFRENESNIWGK
jgi:hypothetical protein